MKVQRGGVPPFDAKDIVPFASTQKKKVNERVKRVSLRSLDFTSRDMELNRNFIVNCTATVFSSSVFLSFRPVNNASVARIEVAREDCWRTVKPVNNKRSMEPVNCKLDDVAKGLTKFGKAATPLSLHGVQAARTSSNTIDVRRTRLRYRIGSDAKPLLCSVAPRARNE